MQIDNAVSVLEVSGEGPWMWKLIVGVIAIGLSSALASAQNHIDNVDTVALQKNKIAALSELSTEYLECSAYFTLTAYCLAGYPAPTVPKLLRDYQHSAKTALNLAISNGRSVGLATALIESRSKLVAARQTQSINGDCLNIGDLSERYSAFCRQLMQVPDKRFGELLEGRICTGLFKCSLDRNNALLSTSTRSADQGVSRPTGSDSQPR
jgi:hypothetical protein